MRKILNCLFLIFISFIVAKAQDYPKTEYKVDKMKHDFGVIKSNGGKVEAIFTYTNIGKNDLEFIKAESECGCTVADYTKTPIKTGQTGQVRATFDPKDEEGPFEKQFRVMVNGTERPTIYFKLTGIVVEEDPSVRSLFPNNMGFLRSNTDNFNFGIVNQNSIDTAKIYVFNDGSKPIYIDSAVNFPEHIKFVGKKIKIDALETKVISAVFVGKKFNEFGSFFQNGTIAYTSNASYMEMPIFFSGEFTEDYSKYTPAQLALAPKTSFDKTVHHFGQMPSGSSGSTVFVLTNNGKSNLKIHKFVANCHCVQVNVPKKEILPNESIEIKVSYSFLGMNGHHKNGFTLFTNDPKATVINLSLSVDAF